MSHSAPACMEADAAIERAAAAQARARRESVRLAPLPDWTVAPDPLKNSIWRGKHC